MPGAAQRPGEETDVEPGVVGDDDAPGQVPREQVGHVVEARRPRQVRGDESVDEGRPHLDIAVGTGPGVDECGPAALRDAVGPGEHEPDLNNGVGGGGQTGGLQVDDGVADPAGRPVTAGPGARGDRPALRVGYAVVDLETTGLSPATDSIIEIGLVLAGPDGAAQRRWSTLVNPGPGPDGDIEVGPTFVHGLVAADLEGAPRFDDVADLLARDLAGRVVVAHNARFDVGFLTRALGRSGHLARGARVPRMCTMEWARHFMATPSRRLTACCEAAGVSIGQHHSALDDAEAAAGLLRHYMSVGRLRGEDPVAWARSLSDAEGFGGWSWNEEAADAQEGRLVPRSGPGVLRR